MDLLERHGENGSSIRLAQIPSNKPKHPMPLVEQHVEKGSNVHTDSLPSYLSLTGD